jgi:hypothetical protein
VLARLQAFEAAFGVTPPHPEDGPAPKRRAASPKPVGIVKKLTDDVG